MNKKRIILIVLALCSLALITSAVQAATITTCTFDKDVYHQGETGLISVTVQNERDEKIRVTELIAMIDYFYTDETQYIQTFFTNATLPVEIELGQSSILYIPFTLPSNISSGYTKLFVKARTEIWGPSSQHWTASDTGTYEPVLYVESPYKEQFEEQQTLNQQLQEQLQEQQTVNQQLQQQLDQQKNINEQQDQQLLDLQTANNTNIMIMAGLGVFTISLAGAIMFLIAMNKKPKATPRPAA